MRRRKRLVGVLLGCLILLLWALFPTEAQSTEQETLDRLWEEINSTIVSDQYYEGSMVKDAIWEIIRAADHAIVQAADEAATRAAAETARQLQPVLEGWKAQAQAASRDRWLWFSGGGLVGITLATLVYVLAQ